MTLLHFVVKPYDPSLDYEKLCKELFDNNKCLAMLESKGGDHLHIQGELAVTEKVYKRVIKEFTLLHYRKKTDPTCHPVKIRARPADEVGFQYMAKEGPQAIVIYKQQITDDDLRELYELSEAHRAELLTGLHDFIYKSVTAELNGKPFPTPSALHLLCSTTAYRYYKSVHKMDPPNIRGLIRYSMREHFDSPAVEAYLAALNL